MLQGMAAAGVDKFCRDVALSCAPGRGYAGRSQGGVLPKPPFLARRNAITCHVNIYRQAEKPKTVRIDKRTGKCYNSKITKIKSDQRLIENTEKVDKLLSTNAQIDIDKRKNNAIMLQTKR